MSNNYKIAETETFSANISKKKLISLYPKIKDYIYPILRKNPFFGPNIKKLKGKLSDIYRYRLGNYRLFYTVDQGKVIVYILDIKDRKDAYKT